MQRGQSERLAPMVKQCLEQAGIAFAEIGRVVVTTGPGSFTGVRVGLSFARALALALQAPCIGVSSLEALALAEGEAGLRGAVIETPGASYAALYRDGAPLIAPRNVERDQARQLIETVAAGAPVSVVGPGALVPIVALALRGGVLDPGAYAPNPSYLRAPHVTLPSAGS